jgi:hypothetical protein
MKYFRSFIAATLLSTAVSLQAAILVTSENFSYSQTFDSLPTGGTGASLPWTNNSTISGWYQGYSGTINENTEWSFQVVPDGTGLVTSGGVNTNISARFANIGHANSTDRSVGLYRPASLTGSVGAVFQNNSGMTLPGFSLGYTGEQWHRGGTEETSLFFEYQIVDSVDGLDINSAPGSWTRVNALRFDSPKFNGGGLNLDGKHADNRSVIAPVTIMATIQEGEFLVTRWYQDRTNTAGNPSTVYHLLAIDNVSMTVIPEPSHYVGALGSLGLLLALVRRRRLVNR